MANASANPYRPAAGFGALVGARSMLGPMLISRALVRRGASVPRSGVIGVWPRVPLRMPLPHWR